MRDSPVASEKIAVDQASRRPRAGAVSPGRISACSAILESIGSDVAGTIRRARDRGPFHAMPNTKQQKKRVRSAARQRLENLRYRSTVKTLTRRLEATVAAGEKDRVEAEHRELVHWIDRAAARGALHRNTAARRKARAARLVGPSPPPAAAAKPRRRLGRGYSRSAPARARGRRRGGNHP